MAKMFGKILNDTNGTKYKIMHEFCNCTFLIINFNALILLLRDEFIANEFSRECVVIDDIFI